MNIPDDVYWGDTHVHTHLSIDASTWGGNDRLGPEQAYRFALGETVIANNGMKAKLRRPLDFIVIADHAEGLGVMRSLELTDPDLVDLEQGRSLLRRLPEIREKKLEFTVEMWGQDLDRRYRSAIWNKVARIADKYNNPGVFTAFIGFEWSSEGQQQVGNLHRVVIFSGDSEKATKVLPFTRNNSLNPEDLWRYMADYQRQTGSDVLAIPHNSNVSNGQMFRVTKFSGDPLDVKYAMTRSRWEPLVEVSQIKGDSEAYPLLSPDDEFADFETWAKWSETWHRLGKNYFVENWSQKEANNKRSEYARYGLMSGISQQARIGVNPFKFGMIGSTDTHTSLASADENNFWGKVSNHEPSVSRLFKPFIEDGKWPMPAWETSAAGYAAIWAEENTRESLFAAMKRKEVYASTGPRITVRFFGGWDYQDFDAFKPDLARIGYQKGVPMGGDLTAAPANKSPRFLIRAVKDPDGASLDRVQVIKGWHDRNGQLHEKIYNVALSDGRKDQGNKTIPVGNTIDIPDASYTNTIGDAELAVVWEDPDFNPDELAFYYLRVLEIPTPRWTAYDAKYFELKNLPEEIPMITQERAYTSPIWYSPQADSKGDGDAK